MQEYILSFGSYIWEYSLFIISLFRLLLAYVIEIMIVIQVFQVDPDTTIRSQLSDFVILIVVLDIDNNLVNLPLFKQLETEYNELRQNLIDSEDLKSKAIEA